MYLSPFKDVWGPRIIFAGPSRFFTQANKEQQRETVHVVYSINNNLSEYNSIGEPRSEPTTLVKISPLRGYSVNENYQGLNVFGEFRSEPTNLVKISLRRKSPVSISYPDLDILGELRSEPNNLV